MWQYEYTAESSARPEDVWACWSDLASWPAWNPGIRAITMDGPLAAGTSFTMTTPPDDDRITLTVIEVDPGRGFTDRLADDGIVVDTLHRAEATDHGTTRIVYRTQITGPAADEIGPRIGPDITADFPEVVAALLERVSAAGRTTG